ncbi:MAG: bifunctional oligoribonuclease/PAP phosphatase NrnA [Bacteroidetes bacterium]|nr:bifunctional oligoribonuclease/PAP phosphatase NrnA [Bacteroidota bacterium]
MIDAQTVFENGKSEPQNVVSDEMFTFAKDFIYLMTAEATLIQLKAIFEGNHRFALIVHTNPDGDAIGSAIALKLALKKLGHKIDLLIPNMYPSFLSWMPEINEGVIFEQQAKHAKAILSEADYVICLDFNSPKRSGALQEDILKATAPRILIDHHIDPELEVFDLAYTELDVSSTAELVYKLLKELNYLHLLDVDIASCLYVGIMTDTGSFSFAIKNPDTFSIVAHLVRLGINAERIHKMVYDTYSENRLRLLGHSISNRMIVLEEQKTAIISLSLKDLEQFDYQIGDTEGLVNYPLSMEKVNLSILITERKDQVRLSFRSKGGFSVNDFSRNHFEGGGHFNAAGGNSQLSLKETLAKLINIIPEYNEQLNYIY